MDEVAAARERVQERREELKFGASVDRMNETELIEVLKMFDYSWHEVSGLSLKQLREMVEDERKTVNGGSC